MEENTKNSNSTTQANNVEIPSLDAMRSYLETKCSIHHCIFDEKELVINDDSISYKDIIASRIVFCNGWKVKDSSFFGWVPMAPVKGEILTIELEQHFKTIYNKSCFIIPQTDGLYKAGSTYDRADLTENTTEAARNEITKKLEALLKMDFKVVKQQAGIRPGTVPRRPLIGCHPTFDRLFLFNGLGTKGVSLGPYFGNELVKCLEEGNNLDTEVDIKKYYSLYFNSHFSKEN